MPRMKATCLNSIRVKFYRVSCRAEIMAQDNGVRGHFAEAPDCVQSCTTLATPVQEENRQFSFRRVHHILSYFLHAPPYSYYSEISRGSDLSSLFTELAVDLCENDVLCVAEQENLDKLYSLCR